MGTAMRASLALPLVLALTSSPVAADSGGTGGPLLPCGTSGGSDPGDDSVEVVNVFKFVKGVCCSALSEAKPVRQASCSRLPVPARSASARCGSPPTRALQPSNATAS